MTPGGRRLAALAGEILGVGRAGPAVRRRSSGPAPNGLVSRGDRRGRRAHRPADRDVRPPRRGVGVAVQDGCRASRSRKRWSTVARTSPSGPASFLPPRIASGTVSALPPDHRGRTVTRVGGSPRAHHHPNWLRSTGSSVCPGSTRRRVFGAFFTRHALSPRVVNILLQRRRGDRRGRGLRGNRPDASALRRRRGAPPSAGPPRRPRNPDRRDVACAHSGPGAGVALGVCFLQRFATTPEATQAISSGRAGRVFVVGRGPLAPRDLVVFRGRAARLANGGHRGRRART